MILLYLYHINLLILKFKIKFNMEHQEFDMIEERIKQWEVSLKKQLRKYL
jgi:hypothetical protein